MLGLTIGLGIVHMSCSKIRLDGLICSGTALSKLVAAAICQGVQVVGSIAL